MKPFAGAVLFCTAAAVLVLSISSRAAAEDRIYKWTDKSGQENYSNDIDNVPEPWRSQYKKEEAKSGGRSGKKDRKSGENEQKEAEKPPDYTAPAGAAPMQRAVQSTNRMTRKKGEGAQPGAPGDADDQERARRLEQKAECRKKLDKLNAELKQKNEEYELAAKWEMMVHTPKYTQDKLRLLGEMEEIKKQIGELEKAIDELDRPMRE
jgi:hypothetical protein